MTHRVKKWRFAGMGMLGLFLLTVLTLSSVGHHAWAGEDAADGRNLSDFTGTGRIDSLKDDQIVINDMQKTLSPSVKYYRQGRIGLKKSSFGVGSKVGYITNSKGEIESLWLLP